MSIANELSTEIAVAILSMGNRNHERLNDLKETVTKVHSILQELDIKHRRTPNKPAPSVNEAKTLGAAVSSAVPDSDRDI
jgi:hypothetical protein